MNRACRRYVFTRTGASTRPAPAAGYPRAIANLRCALPRRVRVWLGVLSALPALWILGLSMAAVLGWYPLRTGAAIGAAVTVWVIMIAVVIVPLAALLACEMRCIRCPGGRFGIGHSALSLAIITIALSGGLLSTGSLGVGPALMLTSGVVSGVSMILMLPAVVGISLSCLVAVANLGPKLAHQTASLPASVSLAATIAAGALAVLLWRDLASASPILARLGRPTIVNLGRRAGARRRNSRFGASRSAIDTTRAGPAHPVRAIRVALGPPASPRINYGFGPISARQVGQLLILIASQVLVFFVLMRASGMGPASLAPLYACGVAGFIALAASLGLNIEQGTPAWPSSATRAMLALLPGLPTGRAGLCALYQARCFPLIRSSIIGAVVIVAFGGFGGLSPLAIAGLIAAVVSNAAARAATRLIRSSPSGERTTLTRAAALIALTVSSMITISQCVAPTWAGHGLPWPAFIALAIGWALAALLWAAIAYRAWQRASALPHPYLAAGPSR